MEQIRREIKKIYESNYFPFVILTIGMLIAHIIIKLNYGDDLNFTKVLKENNFLIWTQNRYETWTSRFIIETIMIVVLNSNPILWRIIDIGVVILLSISISKLFVNNNYRTNNWIITAFLFLYPFRAMSTAGWGTTTINYLWPLSFGMFSLVIVKKILNGYDIKWYEYIFSTLALMFSVNSEQMCGIMLAVYGIITLYLLLKQKVNFFMILQTFLCIISILFILHCPGNAARKTSETVTWFPDFDTLSVFNKIELGFSSSIAKFVFEPNLFFIVLSLLIFMVVVIRNKNKIAYIISGIPLMASIFLGVFAYGISKISPNTPNIVKSVTRYGTITKENYYLMQSYIPIILLIGISICFFISIGYCFEDEKKRVLAIFIVLLGVVSRIIVGFSPTIWASNDRTFIYMYFSLIICAILVYGELNKLELIKLKWVNRVLGIGAFISYIYLISFIFVLEIFKNHENLMNFIKALL